jgi:microsomal dipeptidase-like Zn-dependent dipeptidase
MPAPAPPDGLLPPGLTEGTTIAGLSGPEEYPALVTALRSRGWEGEQLDGLLYANLLRLLRESLPA